MRKRKSKEVDLQALATERKSLMTEWTQWRDTWDRVRNRISPSRGRFEFEENPNREKKVTGNLDHAAQRAQGILVAGLSSGMTSRSRPWFVLKTEDDELNKRADVREWLSQCQSKLYRVLDKGGFYRFFEEGYNDLGTFGNFAGGIEQSYSTICRPTAFPFGSFLFGEDEEDRVAHLHRQIRMSAINVQRKFGEENTPARVKRLIANNQGHEKVSLRHVAGPRAVRDLRSRFAEDMPFRSIYYDDQEGDGVLLRNGGFEVNPVIGVRWVRRSGEAYAPSWCGLNAFGASVSLQHYHLKMSRALDKAIDPPVQGGAGGAKDNRTRIRGNPGDYYSGSAGDLGKGQIQPIHEIDLNVLGGGKMMIDDYREQINQAFFADLFMLTAASDRRQVTATEIAERHEEKLVMLGPVLESLDNELLSPVIDTIFDYCVKAGVIPPPPEVIEGYELKPEYTSLLAQAQKMVQIGATERTIGFVGTVAQIQPEAIDKLDGDAAIDQFASQIGAEPDVIRSKDDVAQIRQDRAAVQAQEQERAEMPAMAQTARLLSEANTRGDERLSGGI